MPAGRRRRDGLPVGLGDDAAPPSRCSTSSRCPRRSRVVSAHRTPQLLPTLAAGAEADGIEVIIAGAGGAAHLPGMVAAHTDRAGARRAGSVEGAATGSTRCCRSCRCPAACPSARSPSARRGPRTPACWRRPSSGISRPERARAAAGVAPASDRRRAGPPRSARPRDHRRHPGRRPARPHAGAGRRAARRALRRGRAGARSAGRGRADVIAAAYDDPDALAALARRCDVVTSSWSTCRWTAWRGWPSGCRCGRRRRRSPPPRTGVRRSRRWQAAGIATAPWADPPRAFPNGTPHLSGARGDDISLVGTILPRPPGRLVPVAGTRLHVRD